MKPCRELRFIPMIFILPLVVGLISCSLQAWEIATMLFWAALAGGWAFYQHITLRRQLVNIVNRAKKLDIDWQPPLSFPKAAENLLEIIENMRKERNSLKEETQQLLGQTQALSRQKQNIHIQEASLQRQIHDILTHIDSGICFLDENGLIFPPLSDYFQQIITECDLEEESIKGILRMSTNMRESECIESWFFEKLRSENACWQLAPEKRILPFSSATGKVKFLQFHFAPLGHKNSRTKVLLEIKEVTAAQNLRQKLRAVEEKLHANIECTREIARADVSLLNEFLKEVKGRIQFFRNSIESLHPGCSSGIFIEQLRDNLQNIKSELKLLQFQAPAKRAGRLQTLLKIVKNASGKLSSGQAREIKQCLEHFVSLLKDYAALAENLLAQSPLSKRGENGKLSDSLLIPIREFRYLTQAALSGTSSPPELIHYIREIEKKFAGGVFCQQRLFEFIDLLERVWETLSRKMREREVKLKIDSASRILLYGDHFKVMELATMLMHASLLRGEITSRLNVSCSVIARKDKADILEVETNVSIRNTSKETLEKLSEWKRTGNKFSHQCQGELITHKRGFRLQLPLVVNKYFSSPLKVASMGSCIYQIEPLFQDVSRWFPFSLELVSSPSDYAKIDIIIAEAKALETLGWHIQEKRREVNRIIPLIALVATDNEKICKQMLQYGANECLKSPPAPSELRWCLLFCLEIIARARKTSKQKF